MVHRHAGARVNSDLALGAFSFGKWYDLFLVWALLAFPTGRLSLRSDRIVVATVVGLLSARSLSRLFFFVPPDVAGYGVENRFLPVTDRYWWQITEDVYEIGFSGAMVLALASVAHRWLNSSTPGRRMLSPALFAATVLASAVAIEYSIGWNADIPGTTAPIYLVRFWALAAVAAALTYGLIRLRQSRSAVVDLVGELGHNAPPARLGDALARALGDPSLTLLSWSDADESYVNDRGERVDVPVDRPNRAVTLIERRDERVAALVHDVALLEDPGLVNAVVAAVRLTVDNERMQTEIEAQLAEVAASRSRIVAASDAERRRIERDLHDGAQQRLVTIALALRLAEARTDEGAEPQARAALGQAALDLGEAIDELRSLARGIHPAILTESGLHAALESLADRSTVPVRLRIDIGEEPPTAIAAAAYFAVAEMLTNIAKHANARQATIAASVTGGTMHITVSDDGHGGVESTRGTGLRGIADRVATVNGTLRVHSPVGEGTRIEVDLPCESP